MYFVAANQGPVVGRRCPVRDDINIEARSGSKQRETTSDTLVLVGSADRETEVGSRYNATCSNASSELCRLAKKDR